MTSEIEDVDLPADTTEATYNASDPAQIAGAKKKAGKKKAERLVVVGAIMEQPQGRRYIYGLLERCHIFGNPFCPGQSDSTAFNLGEANIGRLVLADVIASSPELYTVMITEQSGNK